jgi:hypothetical protein
VKRLTHFVVIMPILGRFSDEKSQPGDLDKFGQGVLPLDVKVKIQPTTVSASCLAIDPTHSEKTGSGKGSQ